MYDVTSNGNKYVLRHKTRVLLSEFESQLSPKRISTQREPVSRSYFNSIILSADVHVLD